MAKLQHSERAKANMTSQLKSQLDFLQKNLKGKQAELKKAQSFLKWNLPGTKLMIIHCEAGIKQVSKDIEHIKIRIKKRQKNGEINKIL